MKVLPITWLVADDRSITLESVELPHFYPYLHTHNEWQLTWVEQGYGTLVVGNNVHNFKSGDVFFIGTDLPHLFKSNQDYFPPSSTKVIKACFLYFNPEGSMASLFNLPEMKEARSFLNQNKRGFKIPHEHSKRIVEKLVALHDTSGTNLFIKFLDLFSELMAIKHPDPLCTFTFSSDKKENLGMRFNKILSYIMYNFNREITLENISEIAFMTPHAFCRYFKKHTGRKFISFLNEVRIRDACKRLVSDANPEHISQVAYDAGFNSITNFNRVFKKLVGCSPRTYIINYKQENHFDHVSPLL